MASSHTKNSGISTKTGTSPEININEDTVVQAAKFSARTQIVSAPALVYSSGNGIKSGWSTPASAPSIEV